MRAALVAFASTLLGCGAAGAPRTPPPDWPPRAHDAPADPWSAAAIGFAQAQIGKRYCWGGTGPHCFDCSGLVQAAWRYGGFRLPRDSEAQARALVEVPPEDVRPGDILWWPGHVALYVGGGAMIEAQGDRAGVIRRRARYPSRVLRVVPSRGI